MDKKVKQMLFYIFFGVALFAVMMNFSTVLIFLRGIISLIVPVLIGLLFAFVLNVPMTGIERRLNWLIKKSNRKPREKLLRVISLLSTLICIILVIAVASKLVIPTLISSVKSIYPLLEVKMPEWIAILENHQIDASLLKKWLSSLDMEQLSGGAGNLWSSVRAIATSTISGAVSVIFGFVISIYTLLTKKKLAVQMKKLTYANLNKKIADKLCSICKLIKDTYTKFLSGQCVEAIILGSLVCIIYSIFRLPYAGIIGFLTSIFAFVPYIGAFASCLIGSVLILLVDPSKVLIGIVVYMAVQFIENQFIYPHVVGSSVGLSPFWTLIAALIGGKLFGILGIIFFIPLTAVMYQLVSENTNRKLRDKGIEISNDCAEYTNVQD